VAALADLTPFRRWLVGAELDGWAVAPAAVVHLRDAYFDTSDWRLWRSGYALRVRRTGVAIEATMKARARGRRAVAVRREITSLLRDGRARALSVGRGEVSVRVRRSIGSAPLRRLFGLRTRRETFAVRHDGRVVAELALDRTRIVVRGGERRLLRVELEVRAGSPAVVARFVATLRRRRHLRIARRSKCYGGTAVASAPPAARTLIVSARSGWQRPAVRSASPRRRRNPLASHEEALR
jgi:inorganic triphosphatase YgiF